jgi:precorrin-2/cobalt-factor-2 C20-methyltransferase
MVSLGAGDIDLITIKGLKALRESDAICVPTKSEDRSFKRSLTHKIVKALMEEHGFKKPLIPVYTPMHYKKEDWQRQVDIIYEGFKEYNTLSFVTLGDSAIYSTVYYLLDIIKVQNPKLYCNSEVIAGVTSFSDASAKIKKPLCLGDSRLEIVPLLDRDVPKTTIYMRPKIGMDTEKIKERGDIYTFENLNYQGEDITPYKKSRVSKYMTLFIDFFK